MIESKVESDFGQDVFWPTISEFVNFSKYVKTLEEGDLSFAFQLRVCCFAYVFHVRLHKTKHFLHTFYTKKFIWADKFVWHLEMLKYVGMDTILGSASILKYYTFVDMCHTDKNNQIYSFGFSSVFIIEIHVLFIFYSHSSKLEYSPLVFIG